MIAEMRRLALVGSVTASVQQLKGEIPSVQGGLARHGNTWRSQADRSVGLGVFLALILKLFFTDAAGDSVYHVLSAEDRFAENHVPEVVVPIGVTIDDQKRTRVGELQGFFSKKAAAFRS